VRVLSVASEIYPLIKTGGLADVVGALPAALKPQGIDVHTLVPGYPAISAKAQKSDVVRTYPELHGGSARLLKTRIGDLDLLILDAPHLFDRPGNPYLGPDGLDWPDSAQRFAAFSYVAYDIASKPLKGLSFDLLHLHDWQSALAAVYTRFNGGPKTILTIHNIAFQGNFDAENFSSLQLPPQAFAMDALEYYGKVNYLKGGIASATAITTVSPTYAEEICSEDFGMGLDGIIRTRKDNLHGIVNGIDTDVWNPATDRLLTATYSAKNIKARTANKRALEKRLALQEGDGIIHGIVSRLTWQKGLDVFAGELDWLIRSGARLALLGAGEPHIEQAIADAAKKHPGRIGAVFGYSEELAHQIQAGADTMLVPSRFEPCGLTQLYGLRYGCVPVVARTGGLADTVIDANDAALASGVATGVHCASVTSQGLQSALARTARLYANPEIWASIQLNGMTQDVSWNRSAADYAKLYRSLLT
jgi:starch synthase